MFFLARPLPANDWAMILAFDLAQQKGTLLLQRFNLQLSEHAQISRLVKRICQD